ncbi:hypothetical protein AAMO2058_001104900 [Amorphochlora amoebiformis]
MLPPLQRHSRTNSLISLCVYLTDHSPRNGTLLPKEGRNSESSESSRLLREILRWQLDCVYLETREARAARAASSRANQSIYTRFTVRFTGLIKT